MFCVIGFLECRKGNSWATSLGNNVLAISSITRSTGMLEKEASDIKTHQFNNICWLKLHNLVNKTQG